MHYGKPLFCYYFLRNAIVKGLLALIEREIMLW